MEPITLAELQHLWPKDAAGALCARLLQRYCFSRAVETAARNDCGPMTAQAEAAANKTLAQLTVDFRTLAVERPKSEPKAPMQPLHRFQTHQTEKTEK